jgi:hypothetical protein
MAADDFAVVVGITAYPELDPLEGPENDAKAFVEWLRAPDGGRVPDANITKFFSSDPLPAAMQPAPTETSVDKAFEAFNDHGLANGGTCGRRLYIFLAGHGCAPTFQETVLLTANAGPNHPGHHIAGRLVAESFRKAAFFEELVLFMDCCRENYPNMTIHQPPWNSPKSTRRPRYLYAYATQDSAASREGLDPKSGTTRGVFTLALLAGLREAQRDEQGRLASSELEDFVFNYMQKTAKAIIGDTVQEPQFAYEKHSQVVFDGGINAPATPVFGLDVTISPASKGAAVELVDGALAVVAPATTSAKRVTWSALEPGIYLLRKNGQPHKFFEMIGGGKVFDETI